MLSGLILVQTVCFRLSADDSRRQRDRILIISTMFEHFLIRNFRVHTCPIQEGIIETLFSYLYYVCGTQKS